MKYVPFLASLLIATVGLAGCSEKGESYQVIYKNDSIELTDAESSALAAVNSMLGEKYQVDESVLQTVTTDASKLIRLFTSGNILTEPSSLETITSTISNILTTVKGSDSEDFEQAAYRVQYLNSRDGDTQEFQIISGVTIGQSNGNFTVTDIPSSVVGKSVVVRDLLINSSETAKNGKAAEPFADEAKAFSEKVFSNAKSIVISYDLGDREDKYNRRLMYVWVDGTLYQELILREGLAKIAYINEKNTTYLADLEKAEQYAIKRKLGLWREN